MPPTFLIDSLNAVRRKAKTLSVAYGIGVVLATVIGLLLASVAIDFLTGYLLNINLAGGLRLILLLGVAAGLVYTAVRFVVRPMVAKLSLSDVAGHIESVFPEFDDRLRSTVNFADASVPGSEFMKQQTVAQASAMVQKVDLTRALEYKPVYVSLSSAIGAVVVLVLVSLFMPEFKTAMARLFTPFSGARWEKKVQIDPAPLPPRVPVGQRVEVAMTLKKGDNDSRKALVYYQYDDGPVQKEYMNRGADGRFVASLDARGDKLKVWMKSEDDETEAKTVQVVPRLAIQRVEAVVRPPAYAQMPPATQNLATGPAYMVTNSAVELQIGFNKDLDPKQPVTLVPVINEGAADAAKAKGEPAPAMPTFTWTSPTSRSAVAAFTAAGNFRFRIIARDADGFGNPGLEEYEVIVRPDQLPSVQIESPKKNVDRAPGAYLPLQILAEDDFGIASMRLIVDRIATAAPENAKPGDPAPAANAGRKHWEIDLSNWHHLDADSQRQRYRLNWDWDLKKTLGDLKPGDVLEYGIEVRDNFRIETPGAPVQVHPPQFSSRLRINIISLDEAAQQATNEIRQLAQQTAIVQRGQNTTTTETRNLKDEVKDKPDMDKGQRKQAEDISARQSTVTNQVKTLSNRLQTVQDFLKENKVQDKQLTDIAQNAKQQLDQAAEKPMTEAVNKLNQAAQQRANPNNPQQSKQAQENRNQALDQAQQAQQEASDKLDKAMQEMNKVGSLPESIRQMERIRDEQARLAKELKEAAKETLGKKESDLTPDQKKKLNDIAQDQKKLADQMTKATEQMEKMSQQMQKTDPQASQAMQQAAQQAKSQQISSKQQQAAQQAQQNQQAGAQAAQQQAQLGIEVVLNTLKDAERRKLEQLVTALAKTVEEIGKLVARQAGHNIDNLDLQGGDAKTKALKKEELEVLYALAKRDAKNAPPPPTQGVLVSGQEQTERNTRSLAKEVEEIPTAAAAAADLVRAAGKMGYAIVDLRDKKMASAYSPHQVEALAALQAALKKAEDELEKAKNQQQAQQKETLKAEFEKVRADQLAKVNQPTTALDDARAKANLTREQTLQLGKLPGEQGGLADRVKKLKEELTKLEGTVYPWAAQQVADSMGEVKDDLGKQKTGKPVQFAEARIIDQLDAMIDSLKQEKIQSKFNQKSNGGGGKGGGGGSKLPTEAELRLMKAIQQGINKETVAANDTKPKDEAEKTERNVGLVSLGNRQGQVRTLLDQLLKKATQGKEGLKPEPDPKDRLPEEAGKEQIENQETDNELLTGDAKAAKETKQLNTVGDRMARSRQRLALDNDPGKVTQDIQKRIIVDLDDMIKQAQQQVANNPQQGQGQGQQAQKPGQQPGQGQQQPGQGQGQQSQPNAGTSAAGNSSVSQAGKPNSDLSGVIKETNREWGSISPRLRDAVIEGSNEQVIDKYRKLVEDYYRGVSNGGKQ